MIGRQTMTGPSGAGPIHERWYDAAFWARVGRLVEADARDVARLALVRAAAKRAKEAAAATVAGEAGA